MGLEPAATKHSKPLSFLLKGKLRLRGREDISYQSHALTQRDNWSQSQGLQFPSLGLTLSQPMSLLPRCYSLCLMDSPPQSLPHLGGGPSARLSTTLGLACGELRCLHSDERNTCHMLRLYSFIYSSNQGAFTQVLVHSGHNAKFG